MWTHLKNGAKQAYKRTMFNLSAANSPVIGFYFKKIYASKPNTLAHFLDTYSKGLGRQLSFIQIGGNDGFTNDPVHKFIKRDGWKGVILEPLPDIFESKLQRLYAKDQEVHTVNAALGTEEGSANIYRIGFSNKRWATGLTSFNRNVLEKAFSSGLVAKNLKKEGISEVPDVNEGIVTQKIAVTTAGSLMRKYNLEQLDLLQIDTEGYDFEVIKMFLQAGLRPAVIVYEHIHLESEVQSECAGMLQDNAYELSPYGANTVAKLK